MATTLHHIYTSPIDRILQKAASHGFKPTEVLIQKEDLLSRFKIAVELCSQISVKQQLLEAAQRSINASAGSVLPGSDQADVLTTLECMSKNLEDFLTHMDNVLEKKETLTNYLQTPFSSNYMVVEADNQAQFLVLYQSISTSLMQMPNTLAVMEWASNFTATHQPQLDRKLRTLCAFLAKCQRYQDALMMNSNLIKDLI